MLHVRRFIITISGVAAWCLAATTTAYAKGVPDPHPFVSVDPVWAKPLRGSGLVMTPPSAVTVAGTPLWQVVAYWVFGILLAVAVVGFGYALSHARRTAPSTRSHA